MTAAVCIPWRAEPVRRAAFDLVRARWEAFGFPVVVGDDSGPFNRSLARNAAARATDADVLIFCDADTVPRSLNEVRWAVDAASRGEWALTDNYWSMVREYTPHHVADPEWPIPEDFQWKHHFTESPGGIQIVPRLAFSQIGGWDPRFKGWGYEDDAFCHAMTAVAGPGVRLVDVLHLWHPTPRRTRFGQPNYKRNAARADKYREAAKLGPAAVRRLRGVG